MLKALLQWYAKPDYPSLPSSDQVTLLDVDYWLSRKAPGHLLTRLITDIGGYTQEERRKLKNYSRSAFIMPLEDIKEHIRTIRDNDFQPAVYTRKGYTLRGSLRTDGFRLQMAFMMNELTAVKYKLLPEHKLPCRLTTTLGGIDDELTEIRHVVTTIDDVARLWGCEPEQINILCLDLGQAFPFAASAILQPPETLHTDPQQHAMDISMRQPPGTDEDDAGDEVKNGTVLFHNLTVKQKAVYQPTFMVQRWLNQRKEKPVKNDQSISSIERDLPALHGPDGSLTRYLNQLKDIEPLLSSFYTDMVLKKNQWNARRARDEEFNLMATRLLSMIGGTLGARRDPNNKVIVGIGLGDFSTTSGLASLHTAFAKYFVRLVS